jgi:cell division protein FtsL
MKIHLSDIGKQVMHVLGGGILTEGFFLKNAGFILLVFVIVALSISNRYSCLSKMNEIQTLQRELKDAKYESLVISTELTSVSRQTQIQALVEKNGIDLNVSKQPAYEIER